MLPPRPSSPWGQFTTSTSLVVSGPAGAADGPVYTEGDGDDADVDHPGGVAILRSGSVKRGKGSSSVRGAGAGAGGGEGAHSHGGSPGSDVGVGGAGMEGKRVAGEWAEKVSDVGGRWDTLLVARLRFKPDSSWPSL